MGAWSQGVKNGEVYGTVGNIAMLSDKGQHSKKRVGGLRDSQVEGLLGALLNKSGKVTMEITR